MTHWLRRLLALALSLAVIGVLSAADEGPGGKKGSSLIDPPEVALRKFTVAPGLKVDLFAAEPDVRNPVAISVDERGRVFVVESDRRRSSVFDIRGHKDWLETDLSFRTVQERADFLRQQLSPTNPAAIKRLVGSGGNGNFSDFNKDGVIDWRDLEVQTERIRLLEDTDGDGRADRASVFADGFTNILAGVAAGVLAHSGDVYFACIPDLWRISRSVNSKLAISSPAAAPANAPLNTGSLITESLLSGFGVHIAFGGHDMHGLIFGPDGKLYWSVADRGADTNLFAKIKNPIPGLTPELLADSGCIFRANPDGSDFEVIAWGLRNPQELAFDEYGNLFTADNNGDGGDKARWHYVVEGADFGWRIGWQWLEARAYQPKMGPWNGERLWHLAESNTAAWLLPPLAHIGHGPAGLAYNPGTGLPAQFDRHFFLCDFPGHVLMWTNIPDGASFKVGPVKNFFGDLGPTDVAFHPDGGVLVSDWFKSFDKSDKGRIYRIHDPATDASKAVQETKRLLAEGMAQRSVNELAALLGHADMRVRLEAQWEMARRAKSERDPAVAELVTVALRSKHRLARLHSIWGMGRVAAQLSDTELIDEMKALLVLLDDKDPWIRAEACDLFQQAALLNAQPLISRLLADPQPLVRARAATALTKPFGGPAGYRLIQSIEDKVGDAVGPKLDALQNRVTGTRGVRGTRRFSWMPPYAELAKLLEDAGQTRDAYLRHAGVRFLESMWAGIANRPASMSPAFARTGYWAYLTNAHSNVRFGALLALRRLGSPEVARFLSDSDPQLVLEAARAINDVPIEAAFPQLAALIAPDGTTSLGALRSVSPHPGPLPRGEGGRSATARSNERSRNGDTRESVLPLLGERAGVRADPSPNSRPETRNSELAFFTLRRALNANFRLGHATNALALAVFAARDSSPEPLRIEALELLSQWPEPPGRDQIMGLWRPLPPREGQPAVDALRPVVASLLTNSPTGVRVATIKAVAALGMKEVDLYSLVADRQQSGDVRVEALKFLAQLNDWRYVGALSLAFADASEPLRIAAAKLQGGRLDVASLAKALESGSVAEKQNALASLALVTGGVAEALVVKEMDALLAGTLPKELQLDVIEAAAKRPSLKPKLAAFESRSPKDDPLAAYRPTLHGGNAENGRKLFIENQQFACFRCHKINGEGGDVGPDLTGLGEKKGREYLLEAIVQPNKEIAAGLESVLIDLKDGTSYAGLVKSENETELVLNSPEDGLMTLKKVDIKNRQRGLSAMPEDLVTFISKRELRDIIEFLATVK